MFALFKKDPVKEIKKQYARLTEQAMQAQRRGDIEGYSKLTAESEELYKKIAELESN